MSDAWPYPRRLVARLVAPSTSPFENLILFGSHDSRSSRAVGVVSVSVASPFVAFNDGRETADDGERKDDDRQQSWNQIHDGIGHTISPSVVEFAVDEISNKAMKEAFESTVDSGVRCFRNQTVPGGSEFFRGIRFF